MYLRKPKTVAVIYGAFTLGLYVAIQGPTMLDLIDLLHVNQNIMSYSLAFASLAYALGGLLSGFLFNYVNRQVLISIFFLIFGIANIVTPHISSYYVFFCVTVFKMLCAGGTDCAANVWILEMWPGKDSVLQALHFSFAVGCALGPLIVEPFLSVESRDNAQLEQLGKSVVTLNDQGSESKIYIPYALSGLASAFAAICILYLYYAEEKNKRLVASTSAPILIQDQAVCLIPLRNSATTTTTPTPTPQTETGLLQQSQKPIALVTSTTSSATAQLSQGQLQSQPQQSSDSPSHPQPSSNLQQNMSSKPEHQPNQQQLQSSSMSPTVTMIEMQSVDSSQTNQNLPPVRVKITSKARDDLVGRPPYYVMFAVALAALCLSFYCGIEITSMNYLTSFATNIDLQLSKSTAAFMSSALTISFAVGRGFGIWIAVCTKPHHLFYLCGAIMASGNILMLIFANTAETLLWCSICWFGIGCGPMFPAIVSFYDDKISKVTNIVSGIFIMGSMFNVALNTLIIGHQIVENALILIVCNLIGSVLLMLLFGTLHMMTKVKKKQRVKKFELKQKQLMALQNQCGQQPHQLLQMQTQHLLAPVPENISQEGDGDSPCGSLKKTPSHEQRVGEENPSDRTKSSPSSPAKTNNNYNNNNNNNDTGGSTEKTNRNESPIGDQGNDVGETQVTGQDDGREAQLGADDNVIGDLQETAETLLHPPANQSHQHADNEAQINA